ncbi:unnamed protein product [Urochloa humidicola]
MAIVQLTRRAVGSAAMTLPGTRLFSTGSVANRAATPTLTSVRAPVLPTPWIARARLASTAATAPVPGSSFNVASSDDSAKENKREREKEPASYWGVAPTRFVKDDGTEWKWSCFRPWDTYEADVSIDLTKHHEPVTLGDKMARWTVKSLRWPTDIFFQRRYGCRAMMLETVAAVPGMVAGAVLHLRSLRRFEQSGGWIRALLEEPRTSACTS